MLRNDRVKGMILGAVAGDCLGMPYVYMKSDQLMMHSQDVCWEISHAGGCSHLMMSGLSAVSECGVCDAAMAKAYRKYVESGREIDCVTALWADGKSAEYGDLGLCGNMLLVRQIPIVLAGAGWDRDVLFEHIERDCRLTHDDPDSIEFAKLYGLCLQGILQGKSRVEIWDDLFEAVRGADAYRGLLASYYGKPAADGADFHHASVAFGHAMYHFWHDTPYVSALRSVILSGGATDVNAACTGALLGAWHGVRAVPGSWLEVMLTQPDYSAETKELQRALRQAEEISEDGGLIVNREMFWHAQRTNRSVNVRGVREKKKLAKMRRERDSAV